MHKTANGNLLGNEMLIKRGKNRHFLRQGLLSSNHRNEMVRLSFLDSDFVRPSTWETDQEKWVRTRAVLDAYRKSIRDYVDSDEKVGPDWLPKNATKQDLEDVCLYLLCGDDLLESFNTPGLWSRDDVRNANDAVIDRV